MITSQPAIDIRFQRFGLGLHKSKNIQFTLIFTMKLRITTYRRRN